MRLPIAIKLALVYAGTACLLWAPVFLTFDHQLTGWVRAERDRELLTQARIMAGLLAGDGGVAGARAPIGSQAPLGSQARFTEIVAAFDPVADRMAAAAPGVQVTILAPSGAVVGDSSLDPAAILVLGPQGNRPEVHDAAYRGEGLASRLSPTGLLMRYAAAPVTTPEGTWVVRLAVPLGAAEARIPAARRRVLMAGAWALAGGLLLCFAAARLLLRPLRPMVRAATALAAGSDSERLRLRAGDELSELGDALDRLASDRARRLSKLEGEKEQLRGVLEGMAEGVLLLGEDGRILLANRAAYSSLPRGETAIGRTPLEVTRSAELDELVRGAQARSAGARGQVTLARGARTFDASVIPLAGRGQGLVVVLHDITELKRLETVRSQFVANISHELRTPLTAIRGFIDTLNEGAGVSEADRQRFLGAAARHSVRLSNLVHDLLTLAKLDSPEFKLTLEPCDLAEAVEHALELHEGRAQGRQVTLAAEMEEGLPLVLGDSTALVQVISNLIDNAVKYNRERGRVVVRAVNAGNQVRVTVEDTGTGIGAVHLPRIFERLYRVDPGRSREEGGTGLGLAIVKHLVLKHGGEVWVTSELGKGSTFGFSLRLAAEGEPSSSTAGRHSP